ncbi:MAG: ABC transporter substrate-binding protein [Chloroflexi bacterium]|nr:ABC transporter substrate-binding protein [Chloroflexota bacterium]
MSRWTLLLVGLVATLALLAAACGTAEEDEDTPVAEEPTATAIVITGSAADTPEPETGDDMDDEDDMTMDENASVSGIPLDPDAKYGGTLQISYTSHSPSFVPWESAAGHSFEVAQMLNNMLIKSRTWGTEEDFNNFAYFELHPDLATDWEQSADGLAYTFNLRDGVDWSDGVPVTCNDIKWSFDTIRLAQDAGLSTSPRKTHYLAVDSIVCPDDLTVVFNLRWAKPAMIEVIGQPYNVIFPAHIYQTEFLETGALRSFQDEPSQVTTGAYRLANYIPGEVFTFERNPDYWDQPLPYLDGVEMRFLGPGSSQIPPALRAGRLHIGSPNGYTGGQADTLLQECTETCQFWQNRIIASSFSPALFINKEREGWMQDQRIHEAFALAVDNQAYITTVRNDWYELPVGCGFYPTSPWAMPKDRCGQITGFADVVGETTEERAAAAAADKERARELLKEAGYDEMNPLTVDFTVWSPIQGDAPQFINDLAAIGVTAEADVQESATAYGNWATANFDFGVHSFWIAGIDPDVTLYEHFYTGSDRNYNRYSNPEFDNLVNQMSRTLDFEVRRELAWDAMEMALNDVAKIVVSHSSYVMAINKDVRGFMPAINYLSAYGPLKRYAHVWLDE